jgi:uncharacterized repeat protein (TIGR02543 family)
LQAPTRAGYTFTGWAEGNGTIAAGSTGVKTFTAQWSAAIEYAVNYTLNGGTNHSGNPAKYTVESPAITLQAPTRAGYEFAGWTEGNTIAAGSTGDKTFNAQWTLIVGHYGVAYELGSGGTNHPDNPDTYTETDAITLKDPTRAGYTFAGWLPSNTIAAGSTGDKTFTAQWTLIVGHYGIAYELGSGGTNHPDNPGAYTETDAITLKAPTRAGYTFAGWLPSNTIAAGSTGDKTFAAQWTATEYAINYTLNGGTNHSENPAGYTVESPTITLQAPTRTGYEFAGWTEGNTIAAGSMGDKIFAAQWTATEYAVNYTLNGGTNHSDNLFKYTVESPTITLQAPTRTGYEFAGWLPDNTIAAGSTGDKTFAAQWSEAIVYSITYKLDGGTNHPDNPAGYTVEDLIALQNPVREGYNFTGWAEGSEIEQGNTGDRIFTAQWKCNEANLNEITVDGMNITGNESDGVFEYEITVCGKTSIALNLSVSPNATVTVNGEPYSLPGHEIAISEAAVVTVVIVSETGVNTREYTLRTAIPVDGATLYWQRWDDVLAINGNSATNGGYAVTGIRWYTHDGTPSGNGNYIRIPQGSTSDYYAEIETGGEWRRVCVPSEILSPDKIMAYPNPVPRSEKVTLKLPEPYIGGVLNIYDIKGSLVKSGLPLPATVNSVDVSTLSSGIYLLRVTGKRENTETVKIIVE